ncbi:MAG: exonuclease domain-containing protein, partial [Turicibacter sanguinis]
MSGPEYRGTKFIPEIIQFGLIIADAEGNLVEKFSAYVKPTIFPQISGKTQEFLKITDASVAYGITYLEFYGYIKEVIARYNPLFIVWGVSDGFILENSYVINGVK